jgi:hypothetical protein
MVIQMPKTKRIIVNVLYVEHVVMVMVSLQPLSLALWYSSKTILRILLAEPSNLVTVFCQESVFVVFEHNLWATQVTSALRVAQKLCSNRASAMSGPEFVLKQHRHLVWATRGTSALRGPEIVLKHLGRVLVVIYIATTCTPLPTVLAGLFIKNDFDNRPSCGTFRMLVGCSVAQKYILVGGVYTSTTPHRLAVVFTKKHYDNHPFHFYKIQSQKYKRRDFKKVTFPKIN